MKKNNSLPTDNTVALTVDLEIHAAKVQYSKLCLDLDASISNMFC